MVSLGNARVGAGDDKDAVWVSGVSTEANREDVKNVAADVGTTDRAGTDVTSASKNDRAGAGGGGGCTVGKGRCSLNNDDDQPPLLAAAERAGDTSGGARRGIEASRADDDHRLGFTLWVEG